MSSSALRRSVSSLFLSLLALATLALPATAQTATVGANWKLQSPATSPSARVAPATAFDAAIGKVVLFGGTASGTGLADTWTYDGTTWTQQFPATSPPKRFAASMAYDTDTGTVVMFGGNSGSGYLADTWTYNGTTWTQQNPATSPPARDYAAMAYDAATTSVVLFGGATSAPSLNDTWTYNGSTWTQQTPAQQPTGRTQSTMAYNAATGTVVLFGGFSASGATLADTWTYNGTNWTQQAPAVSPPSRYASNSAYDTTLRTVVLFGGINGSNVLLADTWTYDGTTWTQQSPPVSPSARELHTMVFDTATSSVVLFGGIGSADVIGDTWNYAVGPFTAATTPVGTAAPQTAVYFTIGTAGTLPALSNANVLTTGSPNLDFTLGTGSTCTGVVTAGQTCTVNVAFTPQIPGLRKGAVVLTNSSGTPLATAYLSGTGTGPRASFQSSVVTPLFHGGAPFYDIVQNGAGDLYISGGAIITRYPAGSTTGTVVTTNNSTGALGMDGAGNVYFTHLSTLWQIPGGTGTPIQIAASACSANQQVAIDGSGNVYIPCVSPRDVIKLAAGSYTLTNTFGLGVLGSTHGLALDPTGIMYVSDSTGGKIWKITPDNVASVVVTGIGVPTDLVLDPAGNLIVANETSNLTVYAPGFGSSSTITGVAPGRTYAIVLTPAGDIIAADNSSSGNVNLVSRNIAPTLTFPSTTVGSVSAAQTVSITNVGNAPLNIAVPTSGVNPAITGPYLLGNSGTCPQVSAQGTVQTLAVSATCTDSITFAPIAGGTTNPGTLTTTDNSNGIAGSTQVVPLTGSSPLAATTLTFTAGANSTSTVGLTTTYTVQVVAGSNVITAGTVSFSTTVNGTTTVIGTGTSNGASFSFTYNAAYAGANTITATFTPTDANAYMGSSATTPLTVAKGSPIQFAGTNDQAVQRAVASTLTIILGYPGSVAPTGAITIQANGSTMTGLGTPTCKAKGLHSNCTYPYTSPLLAGQYTLTYTQAADINYNATSGTSTLTITAPPANPTIKPRPISTRSQITSIN